MQMQYTSSLMAIGFISQVFLLPVSAQAQERNGFIRNVTTNKCLTIPESTGDRVVDAEVRSCSRSRRNTGADRQIFNVVIVGDNLSVRTPDGNKCLNLKASTDNREGGVVKFAGCSAHPDQLWTIVDAAAGSSTQLRNVSSGKCLNVHAGLDNREGGRVTVYSCANTDDQRWNLVRQGPLGRPGTNIEFPSDSKVERGTQVQGMVSETATTDVNQCAKNVLGQLAPGGTMSFKHTTKVSHKFELDVNGFSNRHNHVQGNARLRDWNGQGRMVLTDTATSTGFHLAFQDVVGATEGIYSDDRILDGRINYDINNTYHHPGGIQAQGDYVIIASQGGPTASPASFMLLKVAGNTIDMVNTKTYPENSRDPVNKIGSAGITKLNTGHYLVAIYDETQKDEKRIIRFYISDTQQLRSATRWLTAGRFETECKEFGESNNQCMKGGQGGLNFVTDCNGDIYLIAMDGHPKDRKSKHWFQAYKVIGTQRNVSMQKAAQQITSVGGRPPRHTSFRWSGSVYVDHNGKIHLLSSRRQTGDGVGNPRAGKYIEIKTRTIQ